MPSRSSLHLLVDYWKKACTTGLGLKGLGFKGLRFKGFKGVEGFIGFRVEGFKDCQGTVDKFFAESWYISIPKTPRNKILRVMQDFQYPP